MTRVVGSPASQGDASSWVVFRPSTRCACLGTKNHPALGISLFSRAAHSLFTFLSLQINFRHRPLCFVLRSLQKKYVWIEKDTRALWEPKQKNKVFPLKQTPSQTCSGDTRGVQKALILDLHYIKIDGFQLKQPESLYNSLYVCKRCKKVS